MAWKDCYIWRAIRHGGDLPRVRQGTSARGAQSVGGVQVPGQGDVEGGEADCECASASQSSCSDTIVARCWYPRSRLWVAASGPARLQTEYDEVVAEVGAAWVRSQRLLAHFLCGVHDVKPCKLRVSIHIKYI